MILDAIEWALKAGCNSSLVEAIRSERFQQLTTTYNCLGEQYPPESDEGTALRAGHLAMGRLLNTLPEAEAIQQARTCATAISGGTDLRPLVHYLGEAIIKAAHQCLPSDVLELATQWRGASAEEQINIARRLYFIFRSEPQNSTGVLTMQSVHERMERKLRDVDDQHSVLPGLYGMWDKDKCPANCQGKAQMLTAFGRLVGTRVLYISPLRHSRREMNVAREATIRMMVEDVRERGLETADATMAESIRASYWEKHLEEDTFHVGTALQLCDGRWVLVDPHGLVWGVFPQVWDLDATYRTLEKYRMVLPGLQLIRHDHGQSKVILEQRAADARDLIERSRRLEQSIQANVQNIMDLVELVIQGDDLDLLLRYEAEEKGRELLPLSDPDFRRYITMILVLGGEDKLWDVGALLDPGFLEKRIRSWLTYYHAQAVNLFGNQLHDAGGLLHSACEIGLPEYNLAMSAINSLVWRLSGYRTRTRDVHQFFLNYCFDQVSLSNALADREVGQAAMQTLVALPFVHSICQNRMSWWS